MMADVIISAPQIIEARSLNSAATTEPQIAFVTHCLTQSEFKKNKVFTLTSLKNSLHPAKDLKQVLQTSRPVSFRNFGF